MKLDWTNGVYLNAPRTAAWFEGWIRKRYGLGPSETMHAGDEITRALHAWRAGDRAPTVWALDRMLTKLGGHISEIPDHLWIEAKPNGRRYDEETKAKAVRAVELGEPAATVARRCGVSPKSVRKWAQEKAA